MSRNIGRERKRGVPAGWTMNMNQIELSMSCESLRVTNEVGGSVQQAQKTAKPQNESLWAILKQLATEDQCGIHSCSGHGSVDAPKEIPKDPPVKTPSSRSKTRNAHVGRHKGMADRVCKVHKERHPRVPGPVAYIPIEPSFFRL